MPDIPAIQQLAQMVLDLPTVAHVVAIVAGVIVTADTFMRWFKR